MENKLLKNINSLKNDINLIHNFLIKSNYMMYSSIFNKKILIKKKFVYNLVKVNKLNYMTKSIISAYLIYFFILAKIDEKIYSVNENIRNEINVTENQILIENLILSANELSFKTINFRLFFDDKINFAIENHLN